jgi:catechol 2,3-dioxygenase-like lactoylglutathione lyase family enzyme
MNPPTVSRPFAVQRIDHVVLRVRDLERSIAFYRALLGCEIVKRRDDLGLVHLRAGVSMIDLVSLDGALGRRGGAAAGDEGRNMDHLCLRIEPFDEAAILALFEAHGLAHGTTARSNFGAEGNGPSIYFNDPDGNLIELKGPAVSAQAGAGSRSSGSGPRA